MKSTIISLGTSGFVLTLDKKKQAYFFAFTDKKAIRICKKLVKRWLKSKVKFKSYIGSPKAVDLVINENYEIISEYFITEK